MNTQGLVIAIQESNMIMSLGIEAHSSKQTPLVDDNNRTRDLRLIGLFLQ